MTQEDITVMIYLHFSAIVLAQDFVSLYTVNQKKTWQFIFDYNFG